MHLARYTRYFAVGGVIGLLAMAVLAVAERVLPPSRAAYVAAVLAVYAGGIVLSYLLQKRFTFGAGTRAPDARQFHRFVLVALAGAFATGGLSYALKYWAPWPSWLVALAGVLSFAIACVVVSVLTYLLNHQWVFSQPDR